MAEHMSKLTPTSTNKLDELPELFDIEALARKLCTTERHVRRLVSERRIPFVRVGRFIRFEPAAVAALSRQRLCTPAV